MLHQSLSLRLLFGACLLSSLAAFGCREKAELPFEEYGETIDHLPVVQDLPMSFPIMDEVETKPCLVREEVEWTTHSRVMNSQGRTIELEAELKAKEESERLIIDRAEPTENAVEEPVVEEAAEEVVVEEAAEETVAEEAVEEPAVEEAVEEPAVEEAVEEPAVEEAVEEAVVEEAVEEPAVEEAVEETAAEEAPAADPAESNPNVEVTFEGPIEE